MPLNQTTKLIFSSSPTDEQHMKKTNNRFNTVAQSGRFCEWSQVIMLCALLLAWSSQFAYADLAREQETISKQYPSVDHVSAEQLEKLLGSTGEQVVLFDVREMPEFAVSHIKGAIQIDPEMSGQEFLSRYGSAIKNRKVVFYCSVGYRSSLMAETLLNHSPTHSPDDFLNLRHGLFGWHNQSRDLVRGNTPTELIHPYNFWWGRLLERGDLKSYTPQ